MATAGKVVVACPFCRTRNAIEVARQAHGPKCSSCHKAYHLDRPLHVGEEDFDSTVLQAGVPVLVDFHADWCGPCRAMAPVLDDVAQRVAGVALVVKVNTDESPRISEKYGIRSIPFFAGFAGGELTGTLVGMQTASDLQQLLTTSDVEG